MKRLLVTNAVGVLLLLIGCQSTTTQSKATPNAEPKFNTVRISDVADLRSWETDIRGYTKQNAYVKDGIATLEIRDVFVGIPLATQVARNINSTMLIQRPGPEIALVIDADTIELRIPSYYQRENSNLTFEFLTQVLNITLDVAP